MSDLPKDHPASAHDDKVGEEMHYFKRGQLHSGRGKNGKPGKIVKDRKQAIAISLSMAGKSKTADHAERLMSMGYSEETAVKVVGMLEYAGVDWKKQHQTGKAGPQNPDNYKPVAKETQGLADMDIDNRPGKQPGDQGKLRVNTESLSISGPALPKGPGNTQGGSSKDVQGMRMLG